jgi:hypothetical protein
MKIRYSAQYIYLILGSIATVWLQITELIMSILSDEFLNPPKIDFKRINSAALLNVTPILRRFLPGGRVVGNEYLAKNPKRPDRKLGSFKINITTGRWADFATGDRGGDIISLVAFLRDISQGQAARLIASMLGIPVEVRS